MREEIKGKGGICEGWVLGRHCKRGYELELGEVWEDSGPRVGGAAVVEQLPGTGASTGLTQGKGIAQRCPQR